jgi:hypothetical protein
MNAIVEKLFASEEPAIRYKTRVHLLDEDPGAPELRRLQDEIKHCERVRTLLSERGSDSNIPYHPYAKWYGAHWVLVALADLDYPAGDESLLPLREQEYAWLLSAEHLRALKKNVKAGRTRMHASMEGNAIFALLKLGLSDERIDILVENLLAAQWPDGGWNCDRNPRAGVSSFTETLIPLRGLALYSRLTGNAEAHAASARAAEIFLQRRLFKRLSDGALMSNDFLKLRYPCYWHYDILFGLKVLAEGGFLQDSRCRDALDLLASKRLPDGGFPAEKKHYTLVREARSSCSLVDWGGTNIKRMNPFVTIDALYVLKRAFVTDEEDISQ